MKGHVLALLVLSAFVVVPAFASFPAMAACPNPTVGLEWCPEESLVPVYPRVCYAHIPVTCDILP